MAKRRSKKRSKRRRSKKRRRRSKKRSKRRSKKRKSKRRSKRRRSKRFGFTLAYTDETSIPPKVLEVKAFPHLDPVTRENLEERLTKFYKQIGQVKSSIAIAIIVDTIKYGPNNDWANAITKGAKPPLVKFEGATFEERVKSLNNKLYEIYGKNLKNIA